ncbi:cation:proton antiporter [Alkalihalobacillus alcalophilus ATCC 27647 = CGMCC 1.3604]|uniref:Cation:proton antiporter n=1 Tax=Alkalihalobacillus alcalophilus ATCC 27647 = CGMCC 1.3604 TaxID=1218173 RepID=A0A4S4K253_ALKAL|nr:Na+/H+ antiporter subunit A [Alkalihalobacillus alcalophilus]MED1562910.1 Na+/H+ antiporter subunit A [Alkalihalobacillus alcalophilus]THG91723.1 cation:proton antiporter [Alkalihalobacillus alcalophilus ATCC 27647 = CGMCC 1.3604]
MFTALHWATISPLLLAIIIPFIYKYARQIHTGWFVLVLPVVLFVYFIRFLPTVSNGEVIEQSVPWVPSLGIHFNVYVDGLSLLFALLITGIGALVVLYSIFYLSKKKEQLHNFYVYLLMFMGAMLGVVLSDNLIVLYAFWELTSLASALLISYWYTREKSRYGAQKSMLITVLGGFSMLAGIVLLSMITNTFSIREIIAQADVVASSDLFIPAMLFILLGAFTKSAQFPFHIWLPDAMEAPTPVSAYLHSATMVKAGIYLVARLTPVFGGAAEWFWIISIFGIVTLLWGSLSAVRQKDLKGILAFSTISQLGLIMSLLGLGSATLYFSEGQNVELYLTAVVAAVFHLINHATFKGSLFMSAGIIDHETGTRDIRKLGGLMTIMPITFTLSLIGLASMAGLPPFNGFLSKEMFFTALLNATEYGIFNMETFGMLFPIIAWVASIFTFLYCAVMFFQTFTGKFEPSNFKKTVHEAPIGLLISPLVLASLVIIFGFFPNLLSKSIIEPAVVSIAPSLAGSEYLDVDIYMWHGFNAELFMTIGVILFGTILFLLMNKWTKLSIYKHERDPFNRVYDGALSGLSTGGKKLTDAYMKDNFRQYLIYIYSFMVLFLGYMMIRLDVIDLFPESYAPIAFHEVTLVVVMIAGAITVAIAKTRLKALIGISSLGFATAFFFVLFRAPDLALTQLVIEIASTVLFLLCFYHLPLFKETVDEKSAKLINGIVATSVGTIVTLLAISAHNNRLFEPLTEFFVNASYDEAGGKNMVNVILVDFRGFDTLFELAVLGIAAIGIYAMIKGKVEKEGL